MFLGGLCFGSFVSALVWRLHEQSTRKKLSAKQKQQLSIVHGRSMCPHCRHELAWYDLLPLVSWLSLGGKCRYCHKPIEDSPWVEVLMAFLFVGSYLAWPYGFDWQGMVLFVFWLTFLVGFVALTVYDLRWMLLPNRIVYVLIGLAGLQVAFKLLAYPGMVSTLLEAAMGCLAIAGTFYALFQLSKGTWIGGGDVKLGIIIGLVVGGPLAAVLVLFLASTLGTLYALPQMIRKTLSPTSRIPFGPFLLAATMIVYLSGTRIAEWYLDTFLQ